MLTFNILKPDMLEDKILLEYYFNELKNNFGIDVKDLYLIENWAHISKLIYELDTKNDSLSADELKILRKQLLTTIKGYELYYKDKTAILSLYDININTENMLKELFLFKKRIRQKFVYQTEKYYLKFINEKDIDLSAPLSNIDLSKIFVQSCVVPYNEEIADSSYNMVHFNRLHCPDPSFESINNEILILNQNHVIEEKNKIRRIQN